MRVWIAAALSIGLLAAPAYAQKHGSTEPAKKENKPPPIDEKAYKAALDKIPEPKEKVDPWGQMRPTESQKAKR